MTDLHPDICVPSGEDRILMVGDFPRQCEPEMMTQRREEFTVDWIYRCPPVVAANQMGYIIRTPFPIRWKWTGGDDLESLHVRCDGKHPRFHASSHFGMGIITIQVGMTFRTPEGIGMYVKAPPNVWDPRPVRWLEAFVETDTLRRDFTFNIKVLTPGQGRFETGDPIGCVMPYPLDLIGKFDFEYPTPEQVAQNEQVEMTFAASRGQDMADGNRPSALYRKGVDATGAEYRKPTVKVRQPEFHTREEVDA